MPQAIAGVSASSPPALSRAGGLLRIVSPAELDDKERQRLAALSDANRPQQPPATDLGNYIRNRWYVFRNHRNQGIDPLNWRLLRCQRMFEGVYDPNKLREIEQFGGSTVYSRLAAMKCRGAFSLLRDVYLGADTPWTITPQPDPDVPPDVMASIMQLLSVEAQSLKQAGQPVVPDQLHMRYVSLVHAAQQAARRNATTQANAASDKIEDILKDGGFYRALSEFLMDLTLYPFACLKGPVVRMSPQLTWIGQRPIVQNKPKLCWERIDPFNVYWTPGASNMNGIEIMERKRMTRGDLNDCLDLPGYDPLAVRMALQDYANGLRDWLDADDAEQALNVGRENPTLNLSHMIDALEYHGPVQGHLLLQQPTVDPKLIPDPDRDYLVQSWVVGRHTLKTQINPSPRKRLPYYITSFEKVPGAVVGHSIPDIIEDDQEIANATLRALVNNMGMASGPQVVINTDQVDPSDNADQLYPWKRWHVTSDPMGDNRPPITFFQPQSNVTELLGVYNAINNDADDKSAIPKYVTGESLSGGAGRTASGLSMLMGNSSKVLQTVAANVDGDVMEPALTDLYDMIMLTDTSGLLSGTEQIEVNGVVVALQKETERQKQLQFLQITANPIDSPIVGQLGRARVLRSVASNMGLPDDIVPDDDTIQAEMQAAKQAAAANGGSNPEAELNNAKIENLRATALANLAKTGVTPDALLLLDHIMSRSPPPGSAPAQPGANPAAQAQGSQAPSAAPTQHSDNAPPMNSFQPVSNHGALR